MSGVCRSFLLPLNIMIQIQVPFLYSEYLNIISDACLRMAYFYNILILFAIRKYFHKHVRHIMKNITVKYTGIVQKYSYGHILSVKIVYI